MFPEMILAILAHKRGRRHSLQRLLTLLRARMSVQSRNYLVSDALCDPADSPWHTLYASRDRGSFISVVSLDPDTFDYLLGFFSEHYVVKSGPGKRGRPPKFIHKHGFGLFITLLFGCYRT